MHPLEPKDIKIKTTYPLVSKEIYKLNELVRILGFSSIKTEAAERCAEELNIKFSLTNKPRKRKYKNIAHTKAQGFGQYI